MHKVAEKPCVQIEILDLASPISKVNIRGSGATTPPSPQAKQPSLQIAMDSSYMAQGQPKLAKVAPQSCTPKDHIMHKVAENSVFK